MEKIDLYLGNKKRFTHNLVLRSTHVLINMDRIIGSTNYVDIN